MPKKATGKIRVIHHLSYPFHGDSVNACIAVEPMSLSSFGAAARKVVRLGRGCLLTKLDVEAAYKQVPVHRGDWPLLGFKWGDQFYYERVLPFGLKSSCRLWDWYAAALQFFFERLIGVEVVIHYIDDFLLVERDRDQAAAQLARALALCERLGIPMAPDKTEGPKTCLTFLGIELDTLAMRARLPDDKLAELVLLTEVWATKPSASVRELQSLAGKLNFACAVVPPGRVFTRRIFSQIATQERAIGPHKQWTLGKELLADVAWWRYFLREWNGVSILLEVEWKEAELIELFSDACKEGMGARFRRQWIEMRWTPEHHRIAFCKEIGSMPFLELLALVTAAATWGHQWHGKKITFRCDATAAGDAIAGGRSYDLGMHSLLRHLTLIACRQQFTFRCVHIKGISNVAADLLSRYGDCQKFRAECPDALPHPTLIVEVPIDPDTRA